MVPFVLFGHMMLRKANFFYYFQGDYMQAERLYKSVIQRQVSKGTGLVPLFSWSISNLFCFT